MVLNKINILDKEYINIDVIDGIAIADSFVHRSNKLEEFGGNGEAKLYVGSKKNIERASFFSNYKMNGFLLKKDLIDYLKDAEFEYKNQEQKYHNNIFENWSKNIDTINTKDDIIFFNFEKSNAGNDRFYITSERGDIFYNEFRKIVLPMISYLSILKLKNLDNQEIFYFKPYLDYNFDARHHKSVVAQEEEKIENNSTIKNEDKSNILYARKGQGKYRASLIDEMGECLITRVNDERMLIASHIKPWAVCESDEERVDKYNGLLLTPTFDRLFDQGFISFSNEGQIFVSPYLSPLNTKRLGLIDNKKYDLTLNKRRSGYLEYHRINIFKKG